MSDYLNYRVKLVLHDGSSPTGVITRVDNTQIVLSDVNNVAQSSIKIDSEQISDLKVIQLPPDLIGKLKNQNQNQQKKKKKQQQAKQHTPEVSSVLVDDAILFAGTPIQMSSRSTPIPQAHSNSDSSEDIQQIKQSNEFDFAANLAMFDKKSVFADFQKNDTVLPSDRLVGHNKLPEKYGNDEMVLDTRKADSWDLIGASKGNNKEGKKNNGKQNTGITRGGTPINGEDNRSKNFRLIHLESHEIVPLCSPVQLLEIERISNETYGVSPQLMTEIVSTNLSNLILTSMLGGPGRLSNKKNHNLPPLVLLLIGSGRCGARAFATGRHLTNHGVRVLAFVVKCDEVEDELLSKQWELFELAGGKVITSNFEQLLNIINNGLDTPIELIIDALQGYDEHLEDIFFESADLNTVRQIISWCNEPLQQVKIMSLDIPSGVDGGSGTVLDLGGIFINCRWCISMGLPIIGVIHAYKNNHIQEGGEVLHYLIDSGIPNKVFNSKSNLRKFDRLWFSSGSGIMLQLSVE